MKKTKGIGPNNLGVSKAAVKKVHSNTMAYKIGMGAESYGGAMANKNDYGNSESMANASKYYAMLNDNMEKFGMSSKEAGIKAAKDIKKEK
jgi:hypothetical protein